MFRLPLLARYSAPGAVLDPLRGGRGGLVNFLMPLVPVVVHVATIFVLNQIIYRNVAGERRPHLPLLFPIPMLGNRAATNRTIWSCSIYFSRQ